ncbi:MAG: 4,5-DOPA dioxygenase extradiol [Breznakibacter sp.]
MTANLQPLYDGKSTPLMPAMFVGHGSPMNGISDNLFTRNWAEMANQIPTPKAVLCISAHWLTRGSMVTAMEKPRTIHDFGGFPQELYQVQYPAKGNPSLAKEVAAELSAQHVSLDHEWGLDHGCWTIARHMYPNADIPVLQLSIDYTKPHTWHYQVAKQLAVLRRKGVLIIGSGNMVHNLGRVAWDKMDDTDYGYDWAIDANQTFVDLIEKRQHQSLVNYQDLGKAVNLAVPSPDHYWPLLYVLALQESDEQAQLFNNHCTAGSLSMTSVLFAAKN